MKIQIKSGIGVIAITVVVLFLLSATAIPNLNAKTITLRYADFTPPQSLEARSISWMLDEITQQTNGQVVFQKYFGGSLLGPRESLMGVKSGTADMAHVPAVYHPKELSLWTVAEPFIDGPSDAAGKAAFWWALYEQSPELADQLKEWNQQLIAFISFGRMIICAPKPLGQFRDLKGLRIRCGGGYEGKQISDLGANVIFLRGSEAYSALQKNAVDANYTALTSYYKYRLFEIGSEAKTLWVIPRFTGTTGLITFNLKAWNRLPADVQKTISQIGRDHFSKVISDNIIAEETANLQAISKMGVHVSMISKKDIQYWTKLSQQSCIDKWLAEMAKQDVDTKKLMKRAKALIQKFSR